MRGKQQASARRIKNVQRGQDRTAKQWAKYFFAMLHVDHSETVNEYLDELPQSDREFVKSEMARMANMITKRKGYEWQ